MGECIILIPVFWLLKKGISASGNENGRES